MNESIVVTVILIVLGIGLIGTGALIRIMYGRKYKVVMGTVEKTEVHLRSEEVDYMVTASYNDNMLVTGYYAGSLKGTTIFSKEEEREKALADKFPIGENIKVYVNSKNPSDADIFLKDSGARVTALSICLVGAALIAVSPLVLFLVK